MWTVQQAQWGGTLRSSSRVSSDRLVTRTEFSSRRFMSMVSPRAERFRSTDGTNLHAHSSQPAKPPLNHCMLSGAACCSIRGHGCSNSFPQEWLVMEPLQSALCRSGCRVHWQRSLLALQTALKAQMPALAGCVRCRTRAEGQKAYPPLLPAVGSPGTSCTHSKGHISETIHVMACSRLQRALVLELCDFACLALEHLSGQDFPAG